MSTNFELVRLTLDQLVVQVKAICGKEWADAIKEKHHSLTKAYGCLGTDDRPPIDYSSAAARYAYVHTYVAAHSSWTSELLINSEVICNLLKSPQPLRATCLGGGPGTELIGLLNAAKPMNREAPISYILIDAEDGWAETWLEIDSIAKAPFKVSSAFRCVNVRKPPKFENLAKAFDADIFFAIFFLSEIYSFRAETEPFFDELVKSMKPGAILVYLDNSTDKFTEYATSIFSNEKFEQIGGDDKKTFQLSSNEEKTALGAHLKIAGRSPKLSTNGTSRIWRKK